MEKVQTNTLEIRTLPTGYVPGQVPVAFQTKARLNKIKEVDVDINWQPVKGETNKSERLKQYSQINLHFQSSSVAMMWSSIP